MVDEQCIKFVMIPKKASGCKNFTKFPQNLLHEEARISGTYITMMNIKIEHNKGFEYFGLNNRRKFSRGYIFFFLFQGMTKCWGLYV